MYSLCLKCNFIHFFVIYNNSCRELTMIDNKRRSTTVCLVEEIKSLNYAVMSLKYAANLYLLGACQYSFQ